MGRCERGAGAIGRAAVALRWEWEALDKLGGVDFVRPVEAARGWRSATNAALADAVGLLGAAAAAFAAGLLGKLIARALGSLLAWVSPYMEPGPEKREAPEAIPELGFSVRDMSYQKMRSRMSPGLATSLG